MKKFLLCVIFSIFLWPCQAQQPQTASNVPLSAGATKLWQEFVKVLAPAEAQKAVLRSLSLEIGARSQPEYPAGALLKWLEETSAKATTPATTWEVATDQLMVARSLLRSTVPGDRRRGLRAALSAQKLVLKVGDEPLAAAIAEGFLVPHFDIADESGPVGRAALIEPLYSRFIIYDRRQFEEDGLTLAQEDLSRAFWRVMVSLAPTPDDAIWPRARLAKMLLRPGAPGEDAAAEKARRREAAEVLRGIAPGEGALVFQWFVPQILESVGEKPRPSDLPTPHTGPLKPKPGETPNRVQAAYAAMMARFDHGPQARAGVLAELSKRSGLTPATADALGLSRATVAGWKALRGTMLKEVYTRKTRQELYQVLYQIAYHSNRILEDPSSSDDLRYASLDALWWALYETPKRMTNLGMGWDLGKSIFLHPEFDDLRGRIHQSWFYEHLEDLPDTAVTTTQLGTHRYAFIRGTFRYFRYGYPFWSTTVKAFEGARIAREAKGGENDLVYDPSQVHWAAKSRAAIDLFAVCCETQSQWHEAARALVLALEVEERWGDAMLALSLVNYDREKEAPNKSTWLDLEKEIQAHLTIPKTTTILRR